MEEYVPAAASSLAAGSFTGRIVLRDRPFGHWVESVTRNRLEGQYPAALSHRSDVTNGCAFDVHRENNGNYYLQLVGPPYPVYLRCDTSDDKRCDLKIEYHAKKAVPPWCIWRIEAIAGVGIALKNIASGGYLTAEKEGHYMNARATCITRSQIFGIYPYPLTRSNLKPGWSGVFTEGIDAAVYWPCDEHVYFFKGDQCKVFSWASQAVIRTQAIAGEWPGIFRSGISGGAVYPNGVAYLFSGGEYYRWIIGRGVDTSQSCQAIGKGWQNVPSSARVFTAVTKEGVFVYFFSGTVYYRCDISDPGKARNFVEPVLGPLEIAKFWPGVWNDIDAAYYEPRADAVYFFKGSEYMRFSLAEDRVVSRKPIAP